MEYPRTSEEELPELYDRLDEMLDTAERVLNEQFPTRSGEDGVRIIFEDATPEDFLNAMWAEPEVMVPVFQKVSGLSDREFNRQYGHRNLGSSLRKRKTDFRHEEAPGEFAEALAELLPAELYLETVLFTFVTMWENDQRRHYRARWEETVREYVSERGFPNRKGNHLPGEPDIVVPDAEPYEATGEIRVMVGKDKKKRFKEFGSEARIADDEFPDARFLVVVNVGRHIEEVDREEFRQEIHDEAAGPIDAIFFQDELDDLVGRLDEWNATPHTSLSDQLE